MKMSNKVHLYKNYLVIDFEKPMYRYSNYGVIRLDEKWVKFAIHNFVPIVIRLPQGEKCFFPKQIKKEGQRVKEVFLRPNEPMTLFEIAIPDGEKEDSDRWMNG